MSDSNLDISNYILPNGTVPYEVRRQLQTGCHAYIDGIGTPYGYVPSLAAGIVFLVLFGLTMVGQAIQFAWKRTWWCAVFAVGSLSKYFFTLRFFCTVCSYHTITAEVIGWAGRTWSAECPYNTNAFLMQITTLIIGKPPNHTCFTDPPT
jgi:hypothetical protein